MKFFEGAGKEDLSSWSRSISVVTCCERSRSLLDEVGRTVVVEEVMKKKESRRFLEKEYRRFLLRERRRDPR